jgi:hypothetical protein
MDFEDEHVLLAELSPTFNHTLFQPRPTFNFTSEFAGRMLGWSRKERARDAPYSSPANAESRVSTWRGCSETKNSGDFIYYRVWGGARCVENGKWCSVGRSWWDCWFQQCWDCAFIGWVANLERFLHGAALKGREVRRFRRSNSVPERPLKHTGPPRFCLETSRGTGTLLAQLPAVGTIL